jgi:hypothetical protein
MSAVHMRRSCMYVMTCLEHARKAVASPMFNLLADPPLPAEQLQCSCLPNGSASKVTRAGDTCVAELSASMPSNTLTVALRVTAGDHTDYAAMYLWHVTEVAVEPHIAGHGTALKRVMPPDVAADSCPAGRCSVRRCHNVQVVARATCMPSLLQNVNGHTYHMHCICRYQELPVAAFARVEHGETVLHDVDISSLVTFVTSSPRVAVSSTGLLQVVQGDGAANFTVSIAMPNFDTSLAVTHLQGAISEEPVCLQLLCHFCLP